MQVKDRPKVTFPHESGCLYTVIMTDPDAPKDKAEVHHWMTINIKDGNSETGQVHSEYFGSRPPQGTGNFTLLLTYLLPHNHRTLTLLCLKLSGKLYINFTDKYQPLTSVRTAIFHSGCN